MILVSAGMTCTVVMKEGAAPKLRLGIRKVMAAVPYVASTIQAMLS
jgi:hypothetical protein